MANFWYALIPGLLLLAAGGTIHIVNIWSLIVGAKRVVDGQTTPAAVGNRVGPRFLVSAGCWLFGGLFTFVGLVMLVVHLVKG